MRICKYCGNKTKGKCDCGYHNKKVQSETIYKKLKEYENFLSKNYPEIPLLKKNKATATKI